MKVLVITNLFPNRYEPHKAPFVLQAIQYLSKYCEIKVISPIPCTTFVCQLIKKSFNQRQISTYWGNTEVIYPIHYYIPKIGRSLYGILYLISIKQAVLNLKKRYEFEVVFGISAYPDGFASAIIAKYFKKPFFLWIIGTDINVYTHYFLRRKMILWAVRNSKGVVAASQSLKNKLLGFGIVEEKVKVIYNGVNRSIFYRRSSGGIIDSKLQTTPFILFVGNLKKEKGLLELVKAFEALREDNIHLVIIGEGKFRSTLGKYIKLRALDSKIHLLGSLSHREIAKWMNRSKLLCLPSYNEGVPNVILEALSCGTPVVATDVGGIPEIISSEIYGYLAPKGNINILAQKLSLALNTSWDRDRISQYAMQFSWEKFSERLLCTLKGYSVDL